MNSPELVNTVFFGTADLAANVLKSLVACPQFAVSLVVSQPDKPKGRKLKLHPTPVKQAAMERGLAVLQPDRCRDPAFIRHLQDLKPDLIVVAAYGQILPKALLEIPRWGCLNVHTSLLPKYRGAAPIQWAILNGDPVTGVTVMKMDEGMDTGDIVSMREIAIFPEDNAQTLHDRLAQAGAELLVEILPDYVNGRLTLTPQSGTGVSLAPKIQKSDGRVQWTRDAFALHRQLRGLYPWPGTFTHLPKSYGSRTLKIWNAIGEETSAGEPGEIVEVSCDGIVVAAGEGALRLLEIQLEGGRRMNVSQFIQGHPLQVGDRLT